MRAGRRSYIERRLIAEAESERLKAAQLQHERYQLDSQQKAAIVMMSELQAQFVALRNEIRLSSRAIIKAILEGDTTMERSHAEKIVRDFVMHKGGKLDVR